MIERLSLRKLATKAAVVGTTALTAVMLAGCTTAAKPDGVHEDAARLCLLVGAKLRTEPSVIDKQGNGGLELATLDLDGNPKIDSGEAICVPVKGIAFSKDYANGEWYMLDGPALSSQLETSTATLPNGTKAPVIFMKDLGTAVSKIGKDGAWVNSQRATITDKTGKKVG